MKKRVRNNNGFSLLTVIFVMVVFAVAGVAVISLITGSASMVVNEYGSQRAFAVAQGGLEYIAMQLDGDSDWSDNSAETKSLGGDSFTITYADQSTNTATVQSTATVSGVTRTLQQEFSQGGGISEAFLYAVYSEDDLRVQNSSNVTLDGNVVLGGEEDVSGVSNYDVTGTVVENVAGVTVPTPDWDYWLSVADLVRSGNYNFPGGTSSGIFYVNNHARIRNRSNVTINGTIVARRNVVIRDNSNVTINAQGSNPAIIAQGNVTLRNNSNFVINGWIASLGQIYIRDMSSAYFTGGLTSVDRTRIQNMSNVEVNYSANKIPQTGFIGGTGGLVRGDWREVY